MLLRRRYGLPGHGLLTKAQAAADQLHLFAHGSLGILVHAGIRAIGSARSSASVRGKPGKALMPVQGVEHPLATDEVVQAHGKQRLGLVLQADHLFAALTQMRHLAFEAGADFRQFALHGQLQGALEKGRRTAHAPRTVLRLHKALGCTALAGALKCGAPTVAKGFRKRAPQGGGHRPEFGHGQRLHIVKGTQGQEQALAAEGSVAQGHDLAHEHEQPRHAAHGGQAYAAIQARLCGAGLHEARVLMQAGERRCGVGAFPHEPTRLARERLCLRRQGGGTGETRTAVHAQLHRQRAHVAGKRAFVPLCA